MPTDPIIEIVLDDEPDDLASTAPNAPATPTQSPALREQLAEIGAVLDLPERRPARATAVSNAAVATAAPIPVAAWRKSAAIGTLAVGALIAVVSFWPSQVSTTMPVGILGQWTTSFPGYADREFQFTDGEVIIGMGNGAVPARYPITSVHFHGTSDSTDVDMTYAVDGADVELHATLIERGPARLKFARPEGLIWERKLRAR
ncbi:MAG: hypothetical protein IT353_01630 [Gemmatimonadaceae bacterium]|nr:hypothetical protein [Gemmatimonadaceae bacterium]